MQKTTTVKTRIAPKCQLYCKMPSALARIACMAVPHLTTSWIVPSGRTRAQPSASPPSVKMENAVCQNQVPCSTMLMERTTGRSTAWGYAISKRPATSPGSDAQHHEATVQRCHGWAASARPLADNMRGEHCSRLTGEDGEEEEEVVVALQAHVVCGVEAKEQRLLGERDGGERVQRPRRQREQRAGLRRERRDGVEEEEARHERVLEVVQVGRRDAPVVVQRLQRNGSVAAHQRERTHEAMAPPWLPSPLPRRLRRRRRRPGGAGAG
eukprot:SM000071S21145  [mRNA]  locus=s71:582812:583643:- [translate_table: standard]